MTALIRDHVWRPFYGGGGKTSRSLRGQGAMLARPCEFMNCRRPRAEHERAVGKRHSSAAVGS